MNKITVILAAMFAVFTFSGLAIGENNATQLKKESIAAENIQKGKLNNDKKKADVNVKKIKKSSTCCEPDPIMPDPAKSAVKAR